MFRARLLCVKIFSDDGPGADIILSNLGIRTEEQTSYFTLSTQLTSAQNYTNWTKPSKFYTVTEISDSACLDLAIAKPKYYNHYRSIKHLLKLFGSDM